MLFISEHHAHFRKPLQHVLYDPSCVIWSSHVCLLFAVCCTVSALADSSVLFWLFAIPSALFRAVGRAARGVLRIVTMVEKEKVDEALSVLTNFLAQFTQPEDQPTNQRSAPADHQPAAEQPQKSDRIEKGMHA